MMNRNYKISNIQKALNAFVQTYPEKPAISFAELEEITNQFNKPLIYNIEELISLLSDYIADNEIQAFQLYRESEVCDILKVQKLAMHQWRAKGYITFFHYNIRSIHYNLNTLLEDLKNVRDKNISLKH